jgi:microcystin-dependent protein
MKRFSCAASFSIHFPSAERKNPVYAQPCVTRPGNEGVRLIADLFLVYARFRQTNNLRDEDFMEVFMGTIQAFGFNFAPRGWALCNGQTIGIAQNSALFSLLGVTYGGNGQTTFLLPNLQGRLPLGMGNGGGLSPRVIGEISGTENVTATINNLPNHTHALTGITAATTLQLANPASNPVNTPTATNSFIGTSGTGPGSAAIYSDQIGASPVPLQGVSTTVNGTISPAGNGLPMSVMNPFLAINFSIALEGIFPTRN